MEETIPILDLNKTIEISSEKIGNPIDPHILVFDRQGGYHNDNIKDSIIRVDKSKMYKNLSTIIICPTLGMIHARVVQAMGMLLRPMNQAIVGPYFAVGMEVGKAYESLFDMIFKSDPIFYNYKYILTIEDDIIPPADGLLKLYETIGDYDAISGLYWTKGEGGCPMIYGDPLVHDSGFTPQVPKEDSVQECNGLGMGFTLFKADMFQGISEPFFETLLECEFNKDNRPELKIATQDLNFFSKAKKEMGRRFAVNTSVKCGHMDVKSGKIW